MSRPRRGRLRLAADLGLAVLLFFLLAALAVRLEDKRTRVEQGAAFVVDGDTLDLGGRRIRLVGIDAPEYAQTCRRAGADYACGRLARQALVEAVAGRPVSCSGSRLDRYGRLLGDCRAGEVDLNRAQVAAGWAVAYGDFEAEERAARAAGLGLWAGEFERPQDWRRRHNGADEPRHDVLAAIGDWLRAFFRLP
jgi:endonuclease YncB( thermonuclease family)